MKLTMFHIENGAKSADGKLPSRLKLLGWGDNPAIRGLNVRLGNHTLSTFAAQMQDNNFDKVALDFEHNTVEGTPEFERTKEPRAVAAFGVPCLVPGEGLFLDDISYTPFGETHALCYCDLSPTVHLDPTTGEVDFLHSCALTRAGAVEGLSFYSVEANITQKTGDEMDWKKMLIALTGAADDVSDEDLSKMFEAKLKSMSDEAIEPVQTALSALSVTVAALKPSDAVEAEITALSTSVVALKDDLCAVREQMAAQRRDHLCDGARREGKVIPLSAEQIAATKPEVLAEMISKLAVTVPLDKRTPDHIQALSSAAAGSVLDMVARNCGQDPQKVREVNGLK